jgi:hypothetical protein
VSFLTEAALAGADPKITLLASTRKEDAEGAALPLELLCTDVGLEPPPQPATKEMKKKIRANCEKAFPKLFISRSSFWFYYENPFHPAEGTGEIAENIGFNRPMLHLPPMSSVHLSPPLLR